MEGAYELEDDVFFKDLSRQISLLIMDDDDEDSLSHCPSVNLQVFSQAINPATQAAAYTKHDQQISKRESKGTGVFIPRSSNPRRKNQAKQGRFMEASGNKLQTHNSREVPQMANNIINPSHDHSFNLRRF